MARTVCVVLPLVLMCFLAPGCEDGILVGPIGGEPQLQTDRLVYTLSGDPNTGWRTTLVVRYENHRSTPVYLPGCVSEGPVRPMYGFSRAEPDTSRIIFSLAWACVGGVPALKIQPGIVRIDTLEFVSLVSPAASPPEEPQQRVGFMRVGYAIHSGVTRTGEVDLRTLLPESERRSNIFEIRYPE